MESFDVSVGEDKIHGSLAVVTIKARPGISVDDGSLSFVYSRTGDSVMSFEMVLSPRVPQGEYSFRVFNGDTLVGYVPGVITIDRVKNPWYSTLF